MIWMINHTSYLNQKSSDPSEGVSMMSNANVEKHNVFNDFKQACRQKHNNNNVC